MLLDLKVLSERFDLKIDGIIHLGAHLAEEAALYHELGVSRVVWIEGNADNILKIKNIAQRYGHDVIWALITDKDGEPTEFHITNYDSMSSSVLEFGTHTQFSPDTKFIEHRMMKSSTLNLHAKAFTGCNFLNMDIQGAELLALQGASEVIPQLDYIYTEVNAKEVYKGCAQVGDLDIFLKDFNRVETGWVDRQFWGDALYVRKTHV